MKNYVENSYARLWIAQGLLFIAYKPGTIIDIQVARQITIDRLVLQERKDYPVFVDFRKVKEADKAARDYFASDGIVLMRCLGVLISTSFARTIVEYYRRGNKPIIPVEIFTDKKDALAYLRTFI